MPRYKLTIAYDGTAFHGWQKQHPPDAKPLRTVQGEVEKAVMESVREKVHVLGASRTDAGVHARGQVAAFNCEQVMEPERLIEAITTRLPDDVQVLEGAVVPETFDPIQDCTSKGYRYQLAWGRRRATSRPLFDRHYTAWTHYALDIDSMRAAAAHFVGEHDFASLTRLNHGRESTVRTIHDCTVTALEDDRLHVDVSGDGFLYNMVRILVGTLIEVGRGRLAAESMPALLEARDRGHGSVTMPPEGLCLMWVQYGA
ncbi:MAG: tRNA pseudouridine(38-40) synthase TruA [Phycisphaerales bacterium]|nr:tRNA pseudouridine(38-40) synthase TruA [Phycisphaerales bacterium]